MRIKISIYSIFFIVSVFLVTSIFLYIGFGFIMHQSGNSHHVCPTALMSNMYCPLTGNSMDLAAHHLASFEQVLQGLVGGNSIIVLFVLFIFTAVRTFFENIFPNIRLFYFNRLEKKFLKPTLFIRLFRWFALHNKRDFLLVVYSDA